MRYVSEQTVRDLVTQIAVTAAVREAFIALTDAEAACFPIVRQNLNNARKLARKAADAADRSIVID